MMAATLLGTCKGGMRFRRQVYVGLHVRLLCRVAIAVRCQESIEFFADRIERALLLLAEAAMNQRSLISSDGLHDQLLDWSLV